MATKIKPGAEEPTLRSRRQRKPKRELGHGNWKLVYADFVTVLMAFFSGVLDSAVQLAV